MGDGQLVWATPILHQKWLQNGELMPTPPNGITTGSQLKQKLAHYLSRSLIAALGISPALLPVLATDYTTAALAGIEIRVVSVLLLLLLGTILSLLAWIALLKPWVVFDEQAGTLKRRFGNIRYCTKCKAESRGLIPMKNGNHGWTCMACKKYFEDPARPKSSQPSRRYKNPYF